MSRTREKSNGGDISTVPRKALYALHCVRHFQSDLLPGGSVSDSEDYYQFPESLDVSGDCRPGDCALDIDKCSYKGRCGFLQGCTGSLLTLTGYLVSAAYALMGAVPVGSVIKFAESITRIVGGFQSMGQQYREMALTARREVSTLEMLSISDEMYSCIMEGGVVRLERKVSRSG